MAGRTGSAVMSSAVSLPSDRPWPEGLQAAATVVLAYIGLIGSSAFLDRDTTLAVVSSDGGSLATQVLFVVMAAVAAAIFARRAPPWRALLGWTAALALGGWLLVNIVVSAEPGNTLRRVVTILIGMAGATSVLVANRSPRQLALSLGLFACLVLAISYASLVLVPDLAIHNVHDVSEPEHDGNWRGLFPHKNKAGAAMVVFIFIGWFALRSGERVLGFLTVALATVFLGFTMAKSPIGLLPLVLLQTWVYGRLRSAWLRGALVFGPPVFLCLITVGPVVWPPVGELTRALVSDPTFTGRTDIWSFALDHVAQRPLTGHGLGAFWGTSQVVFGGQNASGWTNLAGDAHNGPVNLAVELGLPGLAIAIWFFAVTPFLDLQRALGGERPGPAAVFFLQVWLFTIELSMFEGVYFEPNDLFWFFGMSIVGLRFLATYRLKP